MSGFGLKLRIYALRFRGFKVGIGYLWYSAEGFPGLGPLCLGFLNVGSELRNQRQGGPIKSADLLHVVV